MGRWVAAWSGLLVALLAGGGPLGAQPLTPVDLELVLAVDASGSVNDREFELQTHGLAEAFRDPEVQAALQAPGRRGIAVTLMQWSGQFQQVVSVDWTLVHDPPSAIAFARRTEATERRFTAETGIANALAFGIRLLEQNRFTGGRRVIDISGDGEANSGGAPDPVRDAAAAARITINGLAILDEIPTLNLYYADHVIGGPDAFLIVAKDSRDFTRAIRQKLLREIQSAPLARREAPGPVLAKGG
jgi:hypothetical protein